MLGEKIKQLREERSVYQRDLARHIGVTPTTISYYERNEKIPKLDNLNKIAEYFGVTVDYLVGEDTSDKLNETYPEGLQLIRRASRELDSKGKAKLTRLIRAFLEDDE